MTTDLLLDIGEEYVFDESPNGSSHDVLLYLDATDTLSDNSTLSDVTTEPTNSNYARQTTTVTTKQISGNYGYDNDSLLSFDFSDQTTSQDVDAGGDVANFQSDNVGGQGGAQDNLVGNPALDQTRDIGSIDTLEVSAGNMQITVD